MRESGPDVFLLGAGFARAISPSMPLLQDLAERASSTRAPGGEFPPAVLELMRNNFAHALSYLEQAKPWVTEADNLRHRALFLDISHAIARDLEATVTDAIRALEHRAPDWLEALIQEWHRERCTVLTLNYDTLIESLAATITLGTEGPLAARQVYPPLLTDAASRSGDSQPEPRRESFQLLKLHGSTNWYYSGRTSAHGEPIYFVPPAPPEHAAGEEHQAHEARLQAVRDKYPFLVPPIYDKSPLLTHETIRALWFQAGEALKRARRVVCMGYSLPESDLTMMHFLRTTCAPDAEFLLVNQSGAAQAAFERLFKGTRVTVRVCATGPDCIARYVQQTQPRAPSR